MGIKHLNRYLTNRCSANAISKQSFANFRHKVFVVDASIYLYRFAEGKMLLEGFYNMISIFKKYGITPVFIFDGKPPVEKKDLLEKRRTEKDKAEKIYNELKIQLNNISVENDATNMNTAEFRERKHELLNEMDTLKKRFVRIRPQDIQSVKELMSAYGTLFIESFGEADQLCAYLVKRNLAWACVSDDMDMFLYGCPRVIRHVSLVNHTGILYDTQHILDDLNMTYTEFRDVMILSGTDYNLQQKIHLFEIMKWYNIFVSETSPAECHFYSWLNTNTTLVVDCEGLAKIRNMFDLDEFKRSNADKLKQIETMPFRNRDVNKSALMSVLQPDGFIFI